MIRTWLSCSVSGLVLAAGVYTACVQSANFARGAELHELQLESEWLLRRASQLRVKLEEQRFEARAPDVPMPHVESVEPWDARDLRLRRSSSPPIPLGEGAS